MSCACVHYGLVWGRDCRVEKQPQTSCLLKTATESAEFLSVAQLSSAQSGQVSLLEINPQNEPVKGAKYKQEYRSEVGHQV